MLVSDKPFVDDPDPYLFRKSAGGDRVYEELIGGTVAWNQLVQNGDFADTSGWTGTNTTFTVSSNVATMARVSTSGGSYIKRTVSKIAGHKYFFSIAHCSVFVTNFFYNFRLFS